LKPESGSFGFDILLASVSIILVFLFRTRIGWPQSLSATTRDERTPEYGSMGLHFGRKILANYGRSLLSRRRKIGGAIVEGTFFLRGEGVDWSILEIPTGMELNLFFPKMLKFCLLSVGQD